MHSCVITKCSQGRQSMGDVCKLVINVALFFLWAWTESWWPDVSIHSFLSLPVWCSVPSTLLHLEFILMFSLPSFYLSLVVPSLGSTFLFKLEVLSFLTPFWIVQTSLLSLSGLLCNPVLSTYGDLWLHIFPPNTWRFVTAKKEKEYKWSPLHPPH